MALEIPRGFKRVPVDFGNVYVAVDQTINCRLKLSGNKHGKSFDVSRLHVKSGVKHAEDIGSDGTIEEAQRPVLVLAQIANTWAGHVKSARRWK